MKKVKVDIYGQEILVFVGREDVDKWIKKNPIDDHDGFVENLDRCNGLAGILFTLEEEGYWFIYMDEKNLETLSHEACHITYMILNMVGIEHDVNNHEAMAYLQEFIFAETARKLKIQTKF